MTIIHKEFLIAWLQGKEVQVKLKGGTNPWLILLEESKALSPSELFYNERYEFRLKPKEQMYRVALLKHLGNDDLYTTTADSNQPDNESYIEKDGGFIRWLTDWVPYSVELNSSQEK